MRVVLISLCLLGMAWGEDKEPAASQRPVEPKKKPRKPHMSALQWLAAHQNDDGEVGDRDTEDRLQAHTGAEEAQ